MKPAVWAYAGLIAVAEAIGAGVSPLLGAIAHGVLVTVLLGHYTFGETAPYRRILMVLVLPSLLRILSLALPAARIPQIFWYVLVGAPMLLGAILAARRLQLSAQDVGLPLRSAALQGVIALSGLALSIAAYSILRPEPLFEAVNLPGLIGSAIILAVFSGFLEEFIFRGVLQRSASELFDGPLAIVLSSLIFASLYIGSLSLVYLGFIGLVGLYFGYCVHKTGSLWGVALAHSLMNIGLLVVWPAVANRLA
jgi:membrane protease YdiL (CAAX protease family)